jgi:hypothetical protein
MNSKTTDSRTSTEQVRNLLLVVGHEQFTLKQLMERTGFKHRPSALNLYINPFIENITATKPHTPIGTKIERCNSPINICIFYYLCFEETKYLPSVDAQRILL